MRIDDHSVPRDFELERIEECNRVCEALAGIPEIAQLKKDKNVLIARIADLEVQLERQTALATLFEAGFNSHQDFLKKQLSVSLAEMSPQALASYKAKGGIVPK